MASVKFPACFLPDVDGGWSVLFPGIKNGFASGYDIDEAIHEAENVLRELISEDNSIAPSTTDEARKIAVKEMRDHPDEYDASVSFFVRMINYKK